MKMQVDQPLPEIMLQNSFLEKSTSTSVLKGNCTVLYFWSQTQMNHYKRTQERVKAYENDYPGYRFVGICIQPQNKLVYDYQKVMEIDMANQFAIVDFENASKKWVLTLLNKGIIIDENGLILEGFGNFYSSSFTDILEKNKP
jgi:peroxiredoxin